MENPIDSQDKSPLAQVARLDVKPKALKSIVVHFWGSYPKYLFLSKFVSAFCNPPAGNITCTLTNWEPFLDFPVWGQILFCLRDGFRQGCL